MKKLASIFFLLLILIGSVYVPLQVHRCQGEVKSFALFGEAKACEHHQNPCPMHGEDGCCDDNTEWIKPGKEQPKQNEYNNETPNKKHVFVAVFFLLSEYLLPKKSVPLKSHTNKAPASVKSIFLLVQNFRI